MRIVASTEELAEVVSAAQIVVPARSPKPVLQCVAIVATDGPDGGVSVAATDFDVSLRVKVERVEVYEPGTCLVDASRLGQILREVSGCDQVEIAVESGTAVIRAGADVFKVLAEPPEDFPELPRFGAERTLKVELAALLDMVRRTAFAAAQEKSRYAMNGVLVEIDGSRLRLVATDGKRLALAEREAVSSASTSTGTGEGAAPGKARALVPTKGLLLVQRLALRGEEAALVGLEETRLQIKTARAEIGARLIEGQFPPYEAVIPKSETMDKRLDLSVKDFQAGLRRASVLTTRDSLSIRFQFGAGTVRMTSRVPDVGESKVELAIGYDYDPLEIAFHPQYLQDALKVLDEERFLLELRSASSAAVIREGESFVYVIMPVSLPQ